MHETQLTRKKYNRSARFYNLTEIPMELSLFRHWRRRLFDNLSGQRVLEIGVGTGKNLKFYPDGLSIVGIDLSEGMMAKAQPIARSKGIALAQMDAEHLAFADATFDAVVATFVFCSVPDPVVGFKEIRRVLKPGGQVMLLEHVLPENRLLAWIFNRVNNFVVNRSGVHINRETADNFRKAGLKSIREENLFSSVFKFFITKSNNNISR